MLVMAVITIRADGETIPPGKEVDIADEREAMSLIERGFAKPVAKASVSPPQISLDDILESIDRLNPETDFTGNGKPKVEAMEAVLGRDISADARDRAWALYQKEFEADDGTDNDVQG